MSKKGRKEEMLALKGEESALPSFPSMTSLKCFAYAASILLS